MTREQAAEQHINKRSVTLSLDISVFTLCRYDLYLHWRESFLAGCEHADKELMERIEQQAQAIKTISVLNDRLAEDLRSKNERIAELEAQLNIATENLKACLEIKGDRIIELSNKIKALESSPKEQPKKLPISKDFATQLQVQCIINERDQPEAQNLLLLVQTINHQLESRSEEHVAEWLEKNWIVTPRDEPQNQPEAQQQEEEIMDIYAPFGTKVIYMGKNGYDSNKEHANKYLKVGETYTVQTTIVDRYHTDVFLVEVPSVAFNHVHFITRKPL